LFTFSSMNIKAVAGDAEVIISIEMHGTRPTIKVSTLKPLEVRLIEWYDGVMGADLEVNTKEFGRAFITTILPDHFDDVPEHVGEAMKAAQEPEPA